jgi:ankyrin repeat protein
MRNKIMKKTTYLLLVTLFLTILSFNTTAQDENPINGKELFEAVKTKNKTRALELIKQGTDLNYQSDDDTTLTEAIRQRDTEMAKALLAAGANPNRIDEKRGASALRMAVQMSNQELVELLINKYKPDVNPKSETGYSILHLAADFNAGKEITALLLAAGSDPNVINEKGQAPYEFALEVQKPDIAQLLAIVTNREKVASLKKSQGVSSEAPKPQQPTAAAADDEADLEDEMEDIAADFVLAFKKKGFKIFGEGFTDAVGRNSNEPQITSTAVYQRTTQTFVMISKNAVALNAKMNGTLLQVPCDDCNTSIANYATSTHSERINGFRVVTLNVALTDRNNFIDLIFKSNTPGERVKWVYLSKGL